MRSQRSKSSVVQPRHELHKQRPEYLPPRKKRHRKKTVFTTPAPTVLKRGVYLFAAFFLAVMGYEIVQAQLHKKDEPRAVFSPVTNVEKTKVVELSKQETQPKIQTKPTEIVKPQTMANQIQPQTPQKVVKTVMPAKAVTAVTPAKPNQVTPKLETVRHVVKPGDTLFKLSRKYYQNSKGVDRIAHFNGLKAGTQLRTGTILYIPLSTK